MKRTHRVHVNLPHSAYVHHLPAREHLARIPRPCFRMTAVKRYRLAKKPSVGEEKLLLARNLCVLAATAVFVASVLPLHWLGGVHETVFALRAAGYALGAGAYLSEMLMITDMFKHMHPLREMLMPYVFGALYVVLAVTYLLEV